MRVTADHKVARHACKDLEVRVGEARDVVAGELKVVGYYVSIAGYGCSKNYKTPKDAVYGMLQDHACYNIHIID